MVVDGEIQLEALGVRGVRIRVAGRRRVGWQDAGRLVTVVLRGVEGCRGGGRGGWSKQRGAGGRHGGWQGRKEGPLRGKKAEEGGLGGWLVMHCANSPRRGHVTRTPGLSLIAPRRNVGHTVPTKHCTLHLTAGFPSASSGQGGGGGGRGVPSEAPSGASSRSSWSFALCPPTTMLLALSVLLLFRIDAPVLRRRVFQSDLSRQKKRRENDLYLFLGRAFDSVFGDVGRGGATFRRSFLGLLCLDRGGEIGGQDPSRMGQKSLKKQHC